MAKHHYMIKSPVKFWLILSLLVATICGVLGLFQAFGSEYVVQDDARSHVVWMLRFIDPELFPNDIIADYFQSVATAGFTGIYYLMAKLGVNPLVFNKLLPIFLGLITTFYCFKVCLQILPIPMAGFLVTLLLNENLWLKDDLVSGIPRAFCYPLFFAFLYYLLKRNLLGVIISIVFLGLLYPQFVLICGTFLILHFVEFPIKKINYKFLLPALVIAAIVLLPYLLIPSEFGPLFTPAEAKQLPAFGPGGRTEFFINNPWNFWVTGGLSGFLPRDLISQSQIAPQVLAGLLLPILLRYSSDFPLTKYINNSRLVILPQLAITSIILFFLSHTFAFKLHIPSRYTTHNLRILMALAGGIAIAIVIDAILPKIKKRFLALCLLTLFLIYPSLINRFPATNYVVGKFPILYEFLSQQPKDTLIASLALEANNLPAFTKRSILVGSEYALPYHKRYYTELHQRSNDLIKAQYSPNLTEVQKFIQKYGIDFWLLDPQALTLNYVKKNHRIRQLNVAAAAEIKASLEKGTIPALSKVVNRCTVLETEGLILLQAECIKKIIS